MLSMYAICPRHGRQLLHDSIHEEARLQLWGSCKCLQDYQRQDRAQGGWGGFNTGMTSSHLQTSAAMQIGMQVPGPFTKTYRRGQGDVGISSHL